MSDYQQRHIAVFEERLRLAAKASTPDRQAYWAHEAYTLADYQATLGAPPTMQMWWRYCRAWAVACFVAVQSVGAKLIWRSETTDDGLRIWNAVHPDDAGEVAA